MANTLPRSVAAVSATEATPLLNPDGSASMATAIMSSHHGLRRDLARFAIALERLAAGGPVDLAALQEEWKSYRNTLHGHHEAEDQGLFPQMRAAHVDLAAAIDRLGADHRQIDPLLERGDRAFAELDANNAARAALIVAELFALLRPHLATEEATVVPHLRGANQFPPPADDGAAAMYAQGFAWSTYGLAAEVLAALDVMLPANLKAKLPQARQAFEQRYERVWRTREPGDTDSSVPSWLIARG